MRAFRALTLNAVRYSVRNRIALFFTLGLAFLFMVIFGLLFGGGSLKLHYGVVDRDQSASSHQLVSALGAIPGVTVSTERDETQALDDLRTSNVDIAVVLPAHLGAALQGAGAAPVQVVSYVGSQTSSSTAVGESVLGQVVGHLASPTGAPITLASPRTAAVNNISAIDFFLPAMLAYIILQSGINYVAIGLADLRARKVLRRFRATPVTPAQILGAQIAGGALTVILQLLVLIAAGLLLFRAHMYGSWLVAIVPMVAGVAAFVGIGFLLTSAARTSEAARGLAAMVAFPMMFLSGIFFPVTQLPDWLQTAVHVLPLTWLSDALHQVMNNGAGLSAIALDCLVLAGWAVLTFAVATWRFRWD